MKVLHLITTMEPGGAEKQLVHLAQQQAKNSDIVYIAFLKGYGTLEKQVAEIDAHFIKTLANKSIFIQYFLLWKLIKHINPDIVHCHLPRSEILGALLKFVSNFGLIVSKHNSEKFWPSGFSFISRMLASFVNHQADAIICITNATKQFLISIRELQQDSKSAVVHYGVSLSRDSDVYSRRLVSSERINLLTFSRLVPQKNLNNLISAISTVRSNQRKAYLSIYGEGELRGALQKHINDLNLTDEVKILSPVLDSDEILSRCDIYLLTSHYEGFGLSVLEALRLNKPVIASNRGALKEVLGADYPYLVDPLNPQEIAEMIITVWRDLLSGHAPNLRIILDKFSMERKAFEISEIYRLQLQDV